MNKALRYLKLSFCVSIIAFFSGYSAIAQSISAARQEYIKQYKEIAIKHMRSYGIPASITLAQGCLESGDGKSTLAVKGNNHFGIKCHNDWKGATIKVDDDKRNECFRKYSAVEDSYKDHSEFLRYRDRYAFLFDLDFTDYKGWAFGLKKAGYATHPQYAQMLIKIIEDYKLYELDHSTQGSNGLFNKKPIPPSPLQLEAIKELNPAKSSPMYKYSHYRTLYIKNKVTYIISSKEDTYINLAKEYNLFLKELLWFNDLEQNQILQPGTVVFIEKKRSKAPRHLDIHIAEEGESYYQIAQRYAVQLKKIYKYNNLKAGDVPVEGEEIYLRGNKY